MQNQNPHTFFTEILTRSKAESQVLKRKLVIFGFARLLAFLLAITPFIFFTWPAAYSFTWCGIFCVIFFRFISKYTDLRLQKTRVDLKHKLCEAELKALGGDASYFGGGGVYNNPMHPFSYDMDLFGSRSFFQSLNRTGTAESEALLATIITSNDIENVLKKQEAIRELATKPEWCLAFRTHQAMQVESVDQNRVIGVMTRHVKLLPAKGALFALIYGCISLVLIGLSMFELISWQTVLIPFFAGLLITAFFIRHVAKISQQSSNLAQNFRHISETLDLIESQKWEADMLIAAAGIKPENQVGNSQILVEFSKILSALDQRNNIFFALIANGLFLWDLRHGSRAEQWILKNAGRIQTIFNQVNAFDAQISLATYAFTHPDFTYPELAEDSQILISATQIGHPLIARTKCVTNSFTVNHKGFFVITGANMAGKSTFLRTVGISLMMANSGLPVFADSFKYKPVTLISSMRSSDSLVNDESYFFAELKRLKFIVDEIQIRNYFIILDEILKGTNSKDKELGSKKFLSRLSGSGSAGLIATHDLSLCDLAETNKTILNYYFDAEIENDELHFDYRLKTGICQNMNASFLLRKMKIVE